MFFCIEFCWYTVIVRLWDERLLLAASWRMQIVVSQTSFILYIPAQQGVQELSEWLQCALIQKDFWKAKRAAIMLLFLLNL